MFATPVCVHLSPVAQEANAELRPLILEKRSTNLGGNNHGEGWRSSADFESWGGAQAQTLFRALRDLADSLTATRSGARVTLDWKITATAMIRQKGEYQER